MAFRSTIQKLTRSYAASATTKGNASCCINSLLLWPVEYQRVTIDITMKRARPVPRYGTSFLPPTNWPSKWNRESGSEKNEGNEDDDNTEAEDKHSRPNEVAFRPFPRDYHLIQNSRRWANSRCA